jgi:hypothetical protein
MSDHREELIKALAEGGRVVGVELDRIEGNAVHFNVTVQPPTIHEITITVERPRDGARKADQ